ncbi:MAG: GNAT family N-acetyltransferase [Erythrobacter sp.]|jgi:RimJ/RimL family protein N-acetyltransferase|nr:GNAT family N-acetyltransferase [Erythrobacter sp.]
MTGPHHAIEDEVIHTRLADGHRVCIRAISEKDRDIMREGIAALSPQSRYLRFFSAAPAQPESVLDKLLDTGGVDHLAWGAIDMASPEPRAIGAVHAIRPDEGGNHEFSIAVIDDFHGKGLGTLLTVVTLAHGRALGIAAVEAYAMMENSPAIGLLAALGADRIATERAVAHYRLEVAPALERARAIRRGKVLDASVASAIAQLERHF